MPIHTDGLLRWVWEGSHRAALPSQRNLALSIAIVVSKTGKRVVPLTDGLIAVLKQQRIVVTEMRLKASRWADNDLLFPTRYGTQIAGGHLLTSFKAMLQSAGLPDCRLHDLRHTAISLMVQSGVPLRTVMSIVGHRQVSTTMHYTHSTADDERAAIAQIDAIFGTHGAA